MENRIFDSNGIALDIETTGLDFITDEIVGLSVAESEGDANYITEPHEISKYMANVYANKTLYLHNANFDLKFLGSLYPESKVVDTLLLAYLINENSSHTLKDLAREYLGPQSLKWYNELQSYMQKNKCKMHEVPEDILGNYANEDTNNTYALAYVLSEKLYKIASQQTILNTREIVNVTDKTVIDYFEEEARPLEEVLYYMEKHGVNVDTTRIRNLHADLDVELLAEFDAIEKLCAVEIRLIEEELYQLELEKRKTPKGKANVKRPVFNLASSSQKGNLIYEKFGAKKINPGGVTATGKWKTDAPNLTYILKHTTDENLRKVCKHLIKIADIQKRMSTFCEGTLSLLKPNNRIYPSYRQMGLKGYGALGTVTGRLSSASPNMQNIPKWFKQVFIPDTEDDTFIYFDYSQIELRVAAYLSQDAMFLKAYREGLDLHKITAAAMLNIELEEVVDWQRQLGKVANFLLIYNGSAYRLLKMLNDNPDFVNSCGYADIDTAKQFRQNFFKRYSGYAKYLAELKDCMLKYKAVFSPFGRIRRLPELQKIQYLDYNNRKYFGPDKDYIHELIENLPESQRWNVFSDGNRRKVTVFSWVNKKVKHAMNQGYNFPGQSTAGSIMKRAMIEIHNCGYQIMNQVHDSIIVQVPKNEVDKHVKVLQDILENIVDIGVPLIAEPKIVDSFEA